MTEIKHDQYVFEDYLLFHPKMSRDQAEFEWHREKQAPGGRTYNSDASKIDFQHPTYDEWQSKNS